MESEIHVPKHFLGLKNYIENDALIRGKPVNVCLVNSVVVITPRGKYDDGLCEEIEFDEGLIDLKGLMALGKLVTHLARETPDPNFYAGSWLKLSLCDSWISPDMMSSEVDVSNFISSLPSLLQTKIADRKEPNVLFHRLFQAKNIFEPLILSGLGLIKAKDGTGYKSRRYISNKEKLCKQFNMDLTSYKKDLAKLGLLDHVQKYTETLNFNYITEYNNEYGEISRTQYAFMMMVLTGLPDKIKKLAVFDCRHHMNRHKKEKSPKMPIHTLSCIIYGLLIEHARTPVQKNKANCRGITAQILTAFSPKKENGEPCYTFNERGVEVALTKNKII